MCFEASGKPGFLWVILILLIIVGCSGGKVGKPTRANTNAVFLQSTSVDGDLFRARVCLDINGNLACDDGEPTGTTDSQGRAALNITGINNAVGLNVLTEAIAGVTVSSDKGSAPIRASYQLLGPVTSNQEPVVVSPITTLVVLKMRYGGLTLEQSVDQLAQTLSLSAEEESFVLADYRAINTSNSMLASRLGGYAKQLSESYKRLGLTHLPRLEGMVDRIRQREVSGADVTQLSVYPVGNLADDSYVIVQRIVEDPEVMESSTLVCESTPERHLGLDLENDSSDPLNEYQWHISGRRNWLDPDLSANILAIASINAKDTYAAGYTGACVKVAVIDSAVSLEHPDLILNVEPGASVDVDEILGAIDTEPRPEKWGSDDLVGHGTSVAGVIAATASNGLGGRGVAPGALLRSFASSFSSGPYPGTLEDSSPYPPDTGDMNPPQLSDPAENDPSENDPVNGRVGDNFDPIVAGNSATQIVGDALFDSSGTPQLADVDVFNASGSLFPEPAIGRLTNLEVRYYEALKAGTTWLREGLGALYVVSSGNGYGGADIPGGYCDTYGQATQDGRAVSLPCQITAHLVGQSSPYSIGVGAHNSVGVATSYSTPGASVWLTAPSAESGSQPITHPSILTTDLEGCDLGFSRSHSESFVPSAFDSGQEIRNRNCDYFSNFGGTSASAPIVSGAIALLLEKHPALNWRQVKYVLAKSARQLEPDLEPMVLEVNGADFEAIPGWATNAAGFPFHFRYGFGGLNVDAAMAVADEIRSGSDGFGLALKEREFQEMAWVESPAGNDVGTVPDNSIAGLQARLAISANAARVIEAVQVYLDLTGTRTSDIAIELVSPAGTRSTLWTPRNNFSANEYELSSQFFPGNSDELQTLKDRNGREVLVVGDVVSPDAPQFSSARWLNTDGSESRQGFVILTSHFLGESSEGTWQLNIIDTASGDQSYQTVVLDEQMLQPQLNEQGEPEFRSVTTANPPQRVLRRWGIKIFGHSPAES